jgi:hypothetical protein
MHRMPLHHEHGTKFFSLFHIISAAEETLHTEMLHTIVKIY